MNQLGIEDGLMNVLFKKGGKKKKKDKTEKKGLCGLEFRAFLF